MEGSGDAISVESIDISELTEERFWKNHVEELKPCRIVGAIRHWPLFRQWESGAYLSRRISSDSEVGVTTKPRGEYRRDLIEKEIITFGEFMRQATAPECGDLVLLAYDIAPSPRASRWKDEQRRRHPLAPSAEGEGLLGGIAGDLTGFPFLQNARPARVYPSYRAFIFRNGYTDWHFHPADETLMCQVATRKEVLLAPPDAETWREIWPIVSEHGGVMDRELRLHGKLHRVVVEPGDALYIPPYWWHRVDPIEDKLGMTVAACFASPLVACGDLGLPAARKLPLSMRFLTPFFAAAVASTYARRALRTVTRGGLPRRA